MGEELSRRFMAVVKTELASSLSLLSDVPKLHDLAACWLRHSDAFSELQELFVPLQPASTLRACCMAEFRRQLLERPSLPSAAVSWVLQLADGTRCGEGCEPELPRRLVRLLGELDFYKSELEPGFLARTAEHYRHESQRLRQSHSLTSYLLRCEQILAKEQLLTSEGGFLEPQTLEPLLSVVRSELIGRHAAELLSRDFVELVGNHQTDDLTRLHRFYEQVDALPILSSAWGKAVMQLGSRILDSSDHHEESRSIIPDLIHLQIRLREVLDVAFHGSSSFAVALKDAFEGFLNAGSKNKTAKLLARHLDTLLKGDVARLSSTSSQPASSMPASAASLVFSTPPPESTDVLSSQTGEQLEANIRHAMEIFRHIAGKDVFEALFRQHLARRLLLQHSSSVDLELYTVQLLREECGGSYTHKMEGMFKDLDLSKTVMDAFVRSENSSGVLASRPSNFTASVLTAGLWPSQPVSAGTTWPTSPSRSMDAFQKFYVTQHSGRSLRWCLGWGQCILRACYEGAIRKELVVSQLQATVLLLFNEADVLSCEEIRSATQIPLHDLQRTLQSLSLHKTVKLLLKQSTGRMVAGTDTFEYNASFNNKLYRVFVSQISPKEQVEEESRVERKVAEDRQHEIDARIVRLMKAKRHLEHQQLLTAVFAALHFPVEGSDVERRIEALIEREFLERKVDDVMGSSSYTYLA
eukprot:TRINITY_DN73307_c0_g1_i1.p1 TRINITY_DN73307_c0_g1~~TRINITY_DN73307_c0_g1_i1.p1  ORF type:complete len:788 (-),score=149.67 TRINITY_DN73307_c0_g1_i1:19-2109(-)